MQKRFFRIKLTTKLPYAPLMIGIAAVNILMLIFLAVIRNNLPPEVPLLYGMPQGDDQLVSSWFLAIPSAISLLTVIVNIVLMKSAKDLFLQQILVGIAGAGTFLSGITTIKIILMVGNY